jgi:hypothetical protein
MNIWPGRRRRPLTQTTRYRPLFYLECIRELLHVLFEVTVVGKELHVGTIDLDTAGVLLLQVLLTAEGSKAPVLGNNDLLSARELVLRSAEGLECNSTV